MTPKLNDTEQQLFDLLKELRAAEWMVTHDWGGDRLALLDKIDAAIERTEKAFRLTPNSGTAPLA